MRFWVLIPMGWVVAAGPSIRCHGSRPGGDASPEDDDGAVVAAAGRALACGDMAARGPVLFWQWDERLEGSSRPAALWRLCLARASTHAQPTSRPAYVQCAHPSHPMSPRTNTRQGPV